MELFRSLVVLVNDTTIGSWELDRMTHNGAKHDLEVERWADRLTDFAQRSQFPDRLRQLARPRFQLLEQPYVLDGDYGLVGESLELKRKRFACRWMDEPPCVESR
jgi:hypothetical protein